MDRLSRGIKWNLVVAVLVLSSAVTVHLAGTPWLTVGAVLVGAVLGAIPLAVLAYRVAQFRDPWQRHLREQDRTVQAQSRPVLPVRAAGERVA